MNILFVAAECAPFVKVGGLGDVVGTLPLALQKLGHSVQVIVPHYGVISDTAHGIRPADRFSIAWNGSPTDVSVSAVEQDGVTFNFVGGWPYFASNEVVYSADEGIDIGRFLFLAAASLQWVLRAAKKTGWRPDVLHLNDWHTALVAYVLDRLYGSDEVLGHTATVFSIHNMQYQGWGCDWHIARAGLPLVDHPLLAAMGISNNSLAAGLVYSTMLSTVSPTYADEIATPAGGYGLDGLVHTRYARLKGVLNGIDTDRWNPATSQALHTRFDDGSIKDRAANRRALQRELGLPTRPAVPVLGTVMRLVDQKGPAIMFPAVRAILETRPSQFVLLGAGQPEHEEAARQLERDFPGRVAARIGFDESLAEKIYGGIDLFLMPSLFEPCGIGQMIAMRYGALPVVRRVGGLADTVDPQTGFVINEHDSGALARVLHGALDLYASDKPGWLARQRQAMSSDFSWGRSAERYVELYGQAMTLHRTYAQPRA